MKELMSEELRRTIEKRFKFSNLKKNEWLLVTDCEAWRYWEGYREALIEIMADDVIADLRQRGAA